MKVAAVTILVGFVTVTEAFRVTCPPQNDILVTLLPSPYNCSTFIMCNDGIPYVMHCQPGLHFNPVEKVCDWPSHAKCNESTIEPTTTEADNTTVETTTGAPFPTTPENLETSSPGKESTTEQGSTETDITTRPTTPKETTTEESTTEGTTTPETTAAETTGTTSEWGDITTEDDWWWWGHPMKSRN